MDKSSTVCSSAEYGEIKVTGDDWEEGYTDMGELRRSPMLHVMSMMSPFKPMNKS